MADAPHNPCKYKRPPNAELDLFWQNFDVLFWRYCNRISDEGYLESASYEQRLVIDCHVRVHQREYYSKIFHNMPKGMSEVKRIALFTYWFLKYCPIKIDFRDMRDGEKTDANAKMLYQRAYDLFAIRFCLFLFESVTSRLSGKDIELTPNIREGLEYDLRHTDITKEALIRIFENLYICCRNHN
ncbi:MAG: hypothetical protein FWB71_03750 [Defluviitaleaceae bacterium]|nr:hypothetical protein [Defluviitaleaceae bacterium]